MALDRAACRKLALDLLARREHSRLELQRKLGKRAFSRELIDETLDELEQSGALSERRFAESFVSARAAKGQGPVRIRSDLARRGVDVKHLDELLHDDEFDWCAIAREARAKRFGGGAPTGYAERVRQARFLQYRGFDMSQIDAALDIGDNSD
ncbi:regulatory protein RecX [Candidatus Rariloculus sp.]|uniref:regulatory protein RecX n=1 Tax=Candidatus Rariloculus sp. TaxID=3101265 RepID=UPI003D132E49